MERRSRIHEDRESHFMIAGKSQNLRPQASAKSIRTSQGAERFLLCGFPLENFAGYRVSDPHYGRFFIRARTLPTIPPSVRTSRTPRAGFWRKWVFSTDHKMIGIQYGVSGPRLSFPRFHFDDADAMAARYSPGPNMPVVGQIPGKTSLARGRSRTGS
jgi:hypothetical protein